MWSSLYNGFVHIATAVIYANDKPRNLDLLDPVTVPIYSISWQCTVIEWRKYSLWNHDKYTVPLFPSRASMGSTVLSLIDCLCLEWKLSHRVCSIREQKKGSETAWKNNNPSAVAIAGASKGKRAKDESGSSGLERDSTDAPSDNLDDAGGGVTGPVHTQVVQLMYNAFGTTESTSVVQAECTVR